MASFAPQTPDHVPSMNSNSIRLEALGKRKKSEADRIPPDEDVQSIHHVDIESE